MTGEVILTVENGPLAGKSYVFKERQVAVVGRADDCDIWVPGSVASMDISRHHCVLDIDPPHMTVRDLGSLNGTWVNGLPVGWLPGEPGQPWKGGILGDTRPLCAGDELRVGHLIFRVRTGIPEDCPPLLVEEVRNKQRSKLSVKPVVKCRKKARPAVAVVENVDLDAWTAGDLMTREVISAPATASLVEVTAILMANKVSAVLVSDSNGRPVGVLSQTDLLAYDCTKKSKASSAPSEEKAAKTAAPEPAVTRAGDLMTPRIFSVPADAAGSAVVATMLSLQVHRLFVTDAEGNMIGVISRTDVLRRLHRSPSRGAAPHRCEPIAAG